MRLLITGTRKPTTKGLKTLRQKLDTAKEKHGSSLIILHGGAIGTDAKAQAWATQNGVPSTVIRPDYKKYYHKEAPLKRNTELVRQADTVLAVWSAEGRKGGTLDTVNKTLAANKPLLEIDADGKTRYIAPRLTLL